MKLSDFRLSTRIAFIAIAFVAAGATTLLFIEDARLRDAYLRGQRVNLEGELQYQKLRLNRDITHLRQNVLFLSGTPPVSGIMRAVPNRGHGARDGDTREIWEARLLQIFSSFLAANPDYASLRYIGVADGGREIVRVDNRGGKIEVAPPAVLQAKADRDYFKATLGLRAGQVHLSEFNLNQERGAIERPYRPTLRAATPVFAPSGQIFGMVVINMDAIGLLEPVALDLPPGVLAYVANASGQYLLHPDERRRFEFEPGGKGDITSDFPFLKAIFDPRATEHFPFQAVAAREPKHYLAAERVHFDPDDPARFLLFAYHLPGAVAAQQIAAVPAGSITAGFLVLLLVGGVGLLVLRRVFAPLERIASAADTIAAGGRDVALPQNGIGEIGRLANAFDIMLARLSQREEDIRRANAELEQRVKERGCDLERAHRETEAALQLHKGVIDTAMDGFWIADEAGNLLTANQAYAGFSGYSVEELTQMHISQLEAKEKPGDTKAHIEKIIAHGSDRFETRHRHKDGHEIDIEVSVTFMHETRQFAAFLRDITVRKRMEEARLRESEERFRGTLEQAAVGIVHAALDGQFRQVNRKFCEIVGYDRDELIPMNFQDIIFPDDRDKNLRRHLQLLAGEISTYSIEKRCVRKDGSPVWTNLTVSLLRDAEGIPKYTIGVIEDISGRKLVEQQLHDLSAHLQIVREEEKASVAREIHDNMGGTLTALKMDVYWLADELSANREAAPLLERIGAMSHLLDDAVGVMRRVITELRPTILDDLGLQAALEWQAGQFQKRTGIQCCVSSLCTGGCKDDLDRTQTIALFRILQESLTNVARHSGASRVEIELRCEEGEIVLAIADNGRGLPEGHTIAPTSYGLLGMRERAEQLGGRIHFYSPPAGGFSVTVILPLLCCVHQKGEAEHDTHPDC
ncbi:MAG: PAS domain S-box protein [Nitrosomonadales bacterium]|nr:PAS domain S-box protein [Nitrosomonadales bacterium]